MMKFRVICREIFNRTVVVYAKNEKEARIKAADGDYSNQISLEQSGDLDSWDCWQVERLKDESPTSPL